MLTPVRSFGEGLNVTDIHLNEKDTHYSFNVLILFTIMSLISCTFHSIALTIIKLVVLIWYSLVVLKNLNIHTLGSALNQNHEMQLSGTLLRVRNVRTYECSRVL